ncbi:MAG: hypothetical protein SPK25_08515, partial [Eubacteriales bacterium]|nr:hypothetical protein [Eubacteriales bacterium]
MHGDLRRFFFIIAHLYHILNLASAVFLPGSLHDELIGNQGDELPIGGLLSLVLLRSNRLNTWVFWLFEGHAYQQQKVLV